MINCSTVNLITQLQQLSTQDPSCVISFPSTPVDYFAANSINHQISNIICQYKIHFKSIKIPHQWNNNSVWTHLCSNKYLYIFKCMDRILERNTTNWYKHLSLREEWDWGGVKGDICFILNIFVNNENVFLYYLCNLKSVKRRKERKERKGKE